MKVKRFFAPDTGKALRMVRDEMGADAIILSNKKVAGGVEVVCTDDYDAVTRQQNRQLSKSPSKTSMTAAVDQAEKLSAELERSRREIIAAKLKSENATKTSLTSHKDSVNGSKVMPISAASSASSFSGKAENKYHDGFAAVAKEPFGSVGMGMDSASFEVMRTEIANLKHMIQQQMGNLAWSNFEKENPQKAIVMQRLKNLGLPEDLCGQLIRQDNIQDAEQGWRRALVKLSQAIPVVNHDLIEKGGVLAFVGPTGSGKTTTIGKLAARYVLKHGAEHIALVTTDTQRIAAQEQIRTFGRILGVPVCVVDEECSLEKTISNLGYKRLILVDTPGHSKEFEALSLELDHIAAKGVPVQTVVTLSSNSHPRVQERAVSQYSDVSLSACVLTKLDETPSLGETLGVVVKNHLPIAYVANGQQVPNDIDVVRPGSLVTLVESLARTFSVQEAERGLSSKVVGGI